MRIISKNIWRIHLLPRGKGSKSEFGFCYQRDIIGIGPQVPEKPTGRLPSHAEHCHRLDEAYEAYKAFSKMTKDDLVWARNHGTDRFYLGEIEGDWEDGEDGKDGEDCEYQHAGIASVLPCRLYEVRYKDAGKYAADFFQIMKADKFQRGRTVQQIDDAYLKRRTFKIWDEIQKQINPNP